MTYQRLSVSKKRLTLNLCDLALIPNKTNDFCPKGRWCGWSRQEGQPNKCCIHKQKWKVALGKYERWKIFLCTIYQLGFEFYFLWKFHLDILYLSYSYSIFWHIVLQRLFNLVDQLYINQLYFVYNQSKLKYCSPK